jgi:general secretion pathway protein C
MATLGRTANQKSPPFLLAEELAPYILMILIGYSIADLSILGIRDWMLPQKAPTARPAKQAQISTPNKASYQTIISRNIFNPDGTIPEPLTAKGTPEKAGVEQAPVPSQLPLNLIGTMVLTNPAKSIADIEVKSKNQDIAVMPNHDIDGIATLIRVERNKAIIRNVNNGRLEFIEIKSQNKLAFNNQGVPAAVTAAKGTGEVKQLAPNKFKLSRATIMKHTSDLSSLLMQASTIPRRKANGDIECYILTSFQPNSIFADLGVQQGDCIKSVNGEPIDSPAKAMELYNALKSTNTIKLTVESDGRDVDKEYSIE